MSTMYNELKAKAKKRVQAKMTFYVCLVIFSFTTIILLMLSFHWPWIAFWLRLPIPILIMVLAIMYLFAFGPLTPGMSSSDWREEQIEKEIVRLYQQKKFDSPAKEDLSESEILELKELEYLEAKWKGGQDYV